MLVEPSEQAGDGGAVSAAGAGVTVLALDVPRAMVILVGIVCLVIFVG